MMSMLIRGFIALLVTSAAAPAVLVFLRRAEVLDHPTERSSHAGSIPRGGGIAPALGALGALAVPSSLAAGHRWSLAMTAATFGGVGLLEDIVGIRALRRLIVQVVLALLAVPLLLEGLRTPATWRIVVTLAVIFWIVAFVNAFNFMDGIDGLSVAQAVVAGLTWVLVGALADSATVICGGAIVTGVALGFAPFNLTPARMFLGDVGSYFIGAWLAAGAVLGLRTGVPPEAVLAPLALYAADTGTTLVRRVLRGERWYLPHRDHAYQRLCVAGWTHLQTSALVACCIAACGLLGVVSLGDSVPGRVAADLGVVGVISGYLFAPRWAARRAPAVAVA